jgi:predicted metal-dependent hydrolase
MHNTEIVIIFIIIFVILFYIQRKNDEVEYCLSSVDKRSYLVRNTIGKEKAANMLARLNKKISKLLSHLKDKYIDDVEIAQLVSNYNVENISEGTEDSKYTSYSVNKGDKIVFCLRSRDGSGSFVDENVLMYVATHELGHLMTKEIGHPESFWKNFKRILEEAILIGVYKRIDYSKSPVEYCGINIKSSVI